MSWRTDLDSVLQGGPSCYTNIHESLHAYHNSSFTYSQGAPPSTPSSSEHDKETSLL